MSATMTTQSPSTVEPVVVDKDMAPLLSFDVVPSLPEMKDRRAHEHDRQRARKTKEVAKMRARKAALFKVFPKSVSPPESEKTKHFHVDDLDILDGILVDTKLEESRAVQTTRPEVKLTDLIVQKKSRRRRDSDFEVVPHIRSVIVLDDNVSHDVLLNEPWQHITGSDYDSDETLSSSPPTYAKILSIFK